MTNKQKVLLSLAIVLTLSALYIYQPQVQEVITGSVSSGSESQSTTTRAVTGTALTDPSRLCVSEDGSARPGALNNIVITGANTGVMNFYDGTTTGPHSDHATRTIASIPASTVAGSYIFDAIVTRGLVYDLDGGLTPTSTVTFKCN